MRRIGTSVAITDPLVKYQSLITTGACCPDLAQHRLAHHLQKIYLRLKDYNPPTEYRSRLREITHAIDQAKEVQRDELAVESHPIRRNPLFARFFGRTEGKSTLALTRVLTSYQGALHVDSPKGLFLSGEVGTGKSMLLDLLADGLPTSKKRRWHFNTFMLYAFSRLEQFRTSHPELSRDDREYSLLWMAKEMIETSPILFLDEFQLPDRAASKILSNLFIAFFQLGGVLVASSNRMPEELEKATGLDYRPPPTGGLIAEVLGLRRRSMQGELYGQTSDFASFLEVLKARCDFWHMEGARDWRRRESDTTSLIKAKPSSSTATVGGADSNDVIFSAFEITQDSGPVETQNLLLQPGRYVLNSDEEEVWNGMILDNFHNPMLASIPWKSGQLIVYGRKVPVPRQCNGTAHWEFDELVHSFGPADYITLASNYHTFIIDHIPVLTVSKKNEARRFITFLDALYEAKCKLLIRAEVGPDDLFFPDMRRKVKTIQKDGSIQEVVNEDATYSETVAEVFQDQVSPFRPNISTYADSPNAKYDPDQDSDFGLEKKVDFVNTGAFTGEDERFAYKRAASRLWEMCSSQWHSRTGDWWQPLPAEARHWEGSIISKPKDSSLVKPATGDVAFGPSIELEEPAGLAGLRVEYWKKGHE